MNIRFVGQRVVKAALTMLAVLVFVFVGARLSGDPISMMFPEGITEEQHQVLLEKYGLDRPLPVQFGLYVQNALGGDFGVSIVDGRPVTDVFASAATETVKLGVYAFIVAAIVGLLVGLIASIRPGSRLARGLMFGAVIGYSVPGFVVAILLIVVFAFHLRLLPSLGMGSASSFILPVVAISVRPIASIARFVRSSFTDVLAHDYIRTARSKGIGEPQVLTRHALRNALIPLVTIIGIILIDILSGALFVEIIFAWPGMGTLLINSVISKDFPVIQFGVLAVSFVVIVVNLGIDMLYGVIDPRIEKVSI